MRKEIFTLLFAFLVIFTLISLTSYHFSDIAVIYPEKNPGNSGEIWEDELGRSGMDNGDESRVSNLFGPVGAIFSHFVFHHVGLGGFWIPILLTFAGINMIRRSGAGGLPGEAGGNPGLQIPGQRPGFNSGKIPFVCGSILIVAATGGLLSLKGEYLLVFTNRFPTGGQTGDALSRYLVGYVSTYGTAILLLWFFIVGLILSLDMEVKRVLQASFSMAAKGIRTTFLWVQKTLKEQGRVSRTGFALPGRIETWTPPHVPDKKAGTGGSNVSGAVKQQAAKEDTVSRDEPPQVQKTTPGQKKEIDLENDGLSAKTESKSLPAGQKNTQSLDSGSGSAVSRKEKSREPANQKENDSSFPFIHIDRREVIKSRSDEKRPGSLPPFSLLEVPKNRPEAVSRENLMARAGILEKKLEDFGVNGKVTAVFSGPVITTFEYQPASGIKISRIVNLADDLALALSALSILIVAPIPGKSVIGIEIPNSEREVVRLREVIDSDEFRDSESKISIALGKDIAGNPVVTELDKMPHLLIAGATGAGKSVAINAMITSILYKADSSEVKLILVDPKRIELSVYDGIPHLISPVVVDVKKATNVLFWALNEMENRYALLSQMKVRNIRRYNKKAETGSPENPEGRPVEKLPYIVIIIDELADLMMTSTKDVEYALTRLAQMARAAGIHLILATQRPSVDVLTGVIKANFPTRISFLVSSKIDSRTILDSIGAENLLGYGDMLFLPPGSANLKRIHGAYISEDEVYRITDALRKQSLPEYDPTIAASGAASKNPDNAEQKALFDSRYKEAVEFVIRTREASVAMIQRNLKIGYNRAARIIRKMEEEGIVGPAEGDRPREVLLPGEPKQDSGVSPLS